MKNSEYMITAYHTASAVCEFTVETDGFSYLVIYGTHVNGCFCTIPNHGIACEMSVPEDIFYNHQSLKRHGISDHDAKAIAAAILEAAMWAAAHK